LFGVRRVQLSPHSGVVRIRAPAWHKAQSDAHPAQILMLFGIPFGSGNGYGGRQVLRASIVRLDRCLRTKGDRHHRPAPLPATARIAMLLTMKRFAAHDAKTRFGELIEAAQREPVSTGQVLSAAARHFGVRVTTAGRAAYAAGKPQRCGLLA
jgi:hypothetical protein